MYCDHRSNFDSRIFFRGEGGDLKSKEHDFTLRSMYYSVLPKIEKNAGSVQWVKVVKLLSKIRMYCWVIYRPDIVKTSIIDIHNRDSSINIQTLSVFFTILIIN